METKFIIQKIEELYKKHGVDSAFIDKLDDKQKIKGMKGVLAELDLNKKKEYSADDLLFIQKIYSMFC